jgi:hypothetical protein
VLATRGMHRPNFRLETSLWADRKQADLSSIWKISKVRSWVGLDGIDVSVYYRRRASGALAHFLFYKLLTSMFPQPTSGSLNGPFDHRTYTLCEYRLTERHMERRLNDFRLNKWLLGDDKKTGLLEFCG